MTRQESGNQQNRLNDFLQVSCHTLTPSHPHTFTGYYDEDKIHEENIGIR